MLTAVVLVQNESDTLKNCLESLRFAPHLLAVADNPTTRTLSLLKSFKVPVILRQLDDDFAAQRNFVLNQVRTEWILFVDADEVVSTGLAGEIISAIKKSEFDGYYLHRTDRMWNHDFKYGDLANVYLLRLARPSAGKWVGKVHETWQISGPTARLKGTLFHTPHPSLVDFLISVNHYSSIRAGELAVRGRTSSLCQIVFWPLGKFIHLWVVRRGWLDGIPGLVHAWVMSFYTFLVRGKLYLWKS